MTQLIIQPVVADVYLFDGTTIGDDDGEGGITPDTTPEWFVPHRTNRTLAQVTTPCNANEIIVCTDGAKVGAGRGTYEMLSGDYVALLPSGALRVVAAADFTDVCGIPADIIDEMSSNSKTALGAQPGTFFGDLYTEIDGLVP